AARSLRYWRSDPRYFTQAIAIVLVAPVIAIGLTFASEFPVGLILTMPLFMAFFGGWAIHNDTAYDSTALWMGISAGVRGRDDRLGRAFAFLIWSLPALLVVTGVILAVAEQWGNAPAMFGVVLGIFGGGAGFSLAISGFTVYPVQPPGTSPFSTTGMGAFGFTMLIQGIAAVATVGLAVPAIITALMGVFLAPVWGYVSLVVGVLTAVASIWAGISLG